MPCPAAPARVVHGPINAERVLRSIGKGKDAESSELQCESLRCFGCFCTAGVGVATSVANNEARRRPIENLRVVNNAVGVVPPLEVAAPVSMMSEPATAWRPLYNERARRDCGAAGIVIRSRNRGNASDNRESARSEEICGTSRAAGELITA